jgi:hypothetical protein
MVAQVVLGKMEIMGVRSCPILNKDEEKDML